MKKLFNPWTGEPRLPSDIERDPDGILMLDPDKPLRAAAPVTPTDAQCQRAFNEFFHKVRADVPLDDWAHAYRKGWQDRAKA